MPLETCPGLEMRASGRVLLSMPETLSLILCTANKQTCKKTNKNSSYWLFQGKFFLEEKSLLLLHCLAPRLMIHKMSIEGMNSQVLCQVTVGVFDSEAKKEGKHGKIIKHHLKMLQHFVSRWVKWTIVDREFEMDWINQPCKLIQPCLPRPHSSETAQAHHNSHDQNWAQKTDPSLTDLSLCNCSHIFLTAPWYYLVSRSEYWQF